LVRTSCPGAARQLSSFSDILQGRRSDLLWVTKEWRPQPVTYHARARSAAKIRQDVVSSAKMQHTVDQVSADPDTSRCQSNATFSQITHQLDNRRKPHKQNFVQGIFPLLKCCDAENPKLAAPN
jgi:hypothetical protein